MNEYRRQIQKSVEEIKGLTKKLKSISTRFSKKSELAVEIGKKKSDLFKLRRNKHLSSAFSFEATLYNRSHHRKQRTKELRKLSFTNYVKKVFRKHSKDSIQKAGKALGEAVGGATGEAAEGVVAST